MKIAIIGGGLAGCALAYVLTHYGQEVTVYEAGPNLAGGASGNVAGLYNPRLSALRGPESDFYAAAYSLALRTFPQLDDIDWRPNGVLHLIDTEKKEERFRKTVQNWNWSPEHMHLVSAGEASEIAGIPLEHGALYLPHGGSVAPHKLCEAYMQKIDLRLNTPIEQLQDISADIKVLACGPSVLKFAPDLPIIPVRGQITQVKETAFSADIKCNICGNGYFMPAAEGIHTLGATFQPSLSHSDIIDADNWENIEKLSAVIPELGSDLEVTGQRASIRATSKHRFPIVGAAPGHHNVYFSAAHGSHGILSSLMSAHILADMILDRPRCLPAKVIAALSPLRFANRT